MPKKSKREKILAEARRSFNKVDVATAPSFQYIPSQISSSQKNNHPADTEELGAIKRDLTKTVLLALVAIAAEFVLFWFERR